MHIAASSTFLLTTALYILPVGLGNITTVPGTGNPIHQGGYVCMGDEERIVDCSPATLSSVCSHSDDLTIECSSTGRLYAYTYSNSHYIYTMTVVGCVQ